MDLVRGEGRMGVFGMAALAAPTALGLTPRCGRFDDVAGRTFGGVAGVLLGCGQGLDQVGVLSFQLRQTLLQPDIALAQLAVLRFERLAALLPAHEDHNPGAQSTWRKSSRNG